VENFAEAVRKLYRDNADQVLKVYAPQTSEEVLQAATDLASARFIAHGTWKWTELQMKTGGKPVYRYFYTRIRPAYQGMPSEASPEGSGGPGAMLQQVRHGAAHSAEIQYAMGNLDLDNRYNWEPDDRKVSETMQAYFVNFIKTGNPNGPGLPNWPRYDAKSNYMRIRIDVVSAAEPEPDRSRYQSLDAIFAQER
jgi:para-nitrobenzyl esterase